MSEQQKQEAEEITQKEFSDVRGVYILASRSTGLC